jgi:hypothetical protein
MVLSKQSKIKILNALNNNTTGFGNGKMVFYDFNKPESPDYQIHPKCKKFFEAVLPPAEENYIHPEGYLIFGTITFYPFLEDGFYSYTDPYRWFRMFSSNEQVVCDGLVGRNSFFSETGDDFLIGSISYLGPVSESLYTNNRINRYKFFLDSVTYNNYRTVTNDYPGDS